MSKWARLSKGQAVILGALVVAAVLVAVLLFAGIPGVSLNASSSGATNYAVTFEETGLPSGTLWQVNLNGSIQSSTSTEIVFSEPNGGYPFTATAQGYLGPSPGFVIVDRGNQLVRLTFSSSKPLGEDLSWGVPYNITGTSPSGCGAPASSYCYAIGIAGVNEGVSTANIDLSLRNSEGATVPWSTGDTISLLTPTNASVVATYDPATSAWQLMPPFTGLLSSGDSIIIGTPATSAGLYGDQLVAIGVNGFSGTVPSDTFP